MTRKNPILTAALSVLAVAALVAGGTMLSASHVFAGDHSKKMDEKLPEGATKVVIPTKGMTCGGCSSAVKTAVKKLDGVIEVQVDHEKGSTMVVYKKDKVTVKKIVEAINKTGFEASEPEDA